MAELSIAISPELQAEIQQIPQAVLKANRLCNGVAGQLARLVANDEVFNMFKGQNGNPPITLLVGTVGTSIKFNKFDPSLSIPWQLDDPTLIIQINKEIATSGVNVLCGTNSRYIDERCWYMGQPGENCTDVCASKKKKYSSFTTSIAGTGGGTLAQCGAVCTAFGVTTAPAQSTPTGVYDCYISNNTCTRDDDQDGDSATSSSPSIARFCVCQ